jgi:hypothetical protein
VRPIAYGEAIAAADHVLRSVASTLGLDVPRLRFRGTDPAQAVQALRVASMAARGR